MGALKPLYETFAPSEEERLGEYRISTFEGSEVYIQ